MSHPLSRRAAIAGIGQTEFSKESGRTELQLACEAVKAALDDAGLTPADVDGLVTFTLDKNEEMEVGRNLGIDEVPAVQPHPLRRRRGGGHGAAGGDGGRHRRRRRGGRATGPSTSGPGMRFGTRRRRAHDDAAVALVVRARSAC